LFAGQFATGATNARKAAIKHSKNKVNTAQIRSEALGENQGALIAKSSIFMLKRFFWVISFLKKVAYKYKGQISPWFILVSYKSV